MKVSRVDKMVFGKLKKLIRHGEDDEETWFIKTLEFLDDARINLFNAEDLIKEEVILFCNVKDSLSISSRVGEYKKFDVIKYRLSIIKGTIERIEKALADAEGPEINCKKRCE
jgi:hypothetical protein